jgi:hypothetical protein
MTDHDEFCPKRNMDRIPTPCLCDLIVKVAARERERQEEGWAARLNSTVAWAENGVRADLRAKVAGLPVEGRTRRGVALVERVRVLALFDGSSDG